MEQERKMKTGIECINAGKVFITPEGEHEVVRDLSFATKENEFLVLSFTSPPPRKIGMEASME